MTLVGYPGMAGPQARSVAPPFGGGDPAYQGLIDNKPATPGVWALIAGTAFNSSNVSGWLTEAAMVALASSSGAADPSLGAGGVPYNSGPAQILEAWCGLSFDRENGKLYGLGGGHNAYGGNEVYDFTLADLSMARLTDPDPLRDPRDEAVPGNAYGMVLSGGSPVGPQPSHTYSGALFKNGKIFKVGYGPFDSNTGGATYVWGGGLTHAYNAAYGGDGQQWACWTFDIATLTWTRWSVFADYPTTTAPALLEDPNDPDNIIMMAGNSVYRYDTVADGWVLTSDAQKKASPLNYAHNFGPALYDSVNGLVVRLNSAGFSTLDPAGAWISSGWQTTLRTSLATVTSQYAAATSTTFVEWGMDFDADAGRFLGCTESGDLFQYYSTDGGSTWTLEFYTGSTGDKPASQYSAPNGGRICQKFFYIPDAKVPGGVCLYIDQRGWREIVPPAIDDAGWA